jgi:mRNA-degrading endonuclease RelE of RelBE toxin-antitoxin system
MFEIAITDGALLDLKFLKKAEQNIVFDAIEKQLSAEPLKQTRNRKQLRPNDLSAWEMRVGWYRVFYDVDEADTKVIVKAVGWKEHNKLFIRGKEYDL